MDDEFDALLALAAGASRSIEPDNKRPVPQPGVIPVLKDSSKNLLRPEVSSHTIAAFNVPPSNQRKRGTRADEGQGSAIQRLSGLKIKKPLVSANQVETKLVDAATVRLGQLKARHRAAGLDGTWATIAVVGEKSHPRESSTGKPFSIWKLTDLDETSISIYLFSAAHSDHSRSTPIGALVAIICPKAASSDGEFKLSVQSPEQIWYLGTSAEFGYCKATRKDGKACTIPVNTAKCQYCTYHVEHEMNKVLPRGRNEFQGSTIGTAFRHGIKRNMEWRPGEFDKPTKVVRPTLKCLKPVQLQGVADRAASKGISKSGAKYLYTVANPSRAIEAREEHDRLYRERNRKTSSQRAPIPLGRAPALSIDNRVQKQVLLEEDDIFDPTEARRRALEMLQTKKSDGIHTSKRPVEMPTVKEDVASIKPMQSHPTSLIAPFKIGKRSVLGPRQATQNPISKPQLSAFAAAFDGVVKSMPTDHQRRSLYADAVEEDEHANLTSILGALEQKDEMAQHMEKVKTVTVNAFKCSRCNYVAEQRREKCASHRECVDRVQSVKRWWMCQNCNYRFTTIGVKYPQKQCSKCLRPGCDFKAVSMYAGGRKEPSFQEVAVASREHLCTRGVEQKWVH